MNRLSSVHCQQTPSLGWLSVMLAAMLDSFCSDVEESSWKVVPESLDRHPSRFQHLEKWQFVVVTSLTRSRDYFKVFQGLKDWKMTTLSARIKFGMLSVCARMITAGRTSVTTALQCRRFFWNFWSRSIRVPHRLWRRYPWPVISLRDRTEAYGAATAPAETSLVSYSSRLRGQSTNSPKSLLLSLHCLAIWASKLSSISREPWLVLVRTMVFFPTLV